MHYVKIWNPIAEILVVSCLQKKNVTMNLNITKACIVCEALIEIKYMLSALCFAWRLLYSAFKMRFVRSQAYVDSIKV